MPYVNVARYHCSACAAMLMMSSQEVNRDKRLIVRIRNKAPILSLGRLQDRETNVKHIFKRVLGETNKFKIHNFQEKINLSNKHSCYSRRM